MQCNIQQIAPPRPDNKGHLGKFEPISIYDIEISTKIGEGEFGNVYEGKYVYDKLSGIEKIPVAIKHLKIREKSSEFYREAKILGSLKHSSIVRAYGVCYKQNMIVNCKKNLFDQFLVINKHF